MTPCFADTYYFLALLNARDEAHERAVALANELRGSIVTTTWVLTELADGLAETPGRSVFAEFLVRFRGDERAIIVETSDELFERGVELYQGRPDKGWSLTDCISFTVMQDREITDALTADHHFEQAGFTLLMR
jgi:predicted nucleic acid-binding protein